MPEHIILHNAERAWHLYTILETLGWQWTINDILAQPEADLEDVLKIRDWHNTIRLMRFEEKNAR